MIYIGSARSDENGKYVNGKAGDQTGKEVSTQQFYVHSKGWYILRAKSSSHANKLADAMLIACNNNNIGYDQNQRLGVITKGINATSATECDCSSLVRACIIYACGVDVGNFTTANEASVLEKSGLFEKKVKYTSTSKLRNGDILVTCEKGHTVIVVSGADNVADTCTYYPRYTGTSTSIVNALGAVGEKNTSFAHRSKIAKENGISGYIGTASQNTKMLSLLKGGVLKKCK